MYHSLLRYVITRKLAQMWSLGKMLLLCSVLFCLADVRHMWEAIFLLERARVSTPQISVLLMTCYGLVGACENLVDVYQAASVKHLQIDTIG